jgi:hypothetical protein
LNKNIAYQLKLCPFCPANDPDEIKVTGEDNGFWVECLNCDARGPRMESLNEAMSEWNERPKRKKWRIYNDDD